MSPNYFGHPVIDYRDVPDGIITEAGIYSNVSMHTYHRDTNLFGGAPSVSSGVYRKVENMSMEKVWDCNPHNPKAEPEQDSDAFKFGRAVHMLFGGEKGFAEQFVVRPETYTHEKDGEKPWNGNANVCKAWLAAAERKGVAVLKPDEMGDIRGMAIRLAQEPFVQNGGMSGLVEHSLFCPRDVEVSDANGEVHTVRIWEKGRPDNLPLAAPMVVDYKTAEDASPIGARRAIGERGYHQQLALISDLLFRISGVTIEADDHVLVMQEKSRPYAVNIKPLTSLAIEYGRRQNLRAAMKFAQCWFDKKWPGYDDTEVPAELPDYLMKRLAFEAEKGLLPPAERRVAKTL